MATVEDLAPLGGVNATAEQQAGIEDLLRTEVNRERLGHGMSVTESGIYQALSVAHQTVPNGEK